MRFSSSRIPIYIPLLLLPSPSTATPQFTNNAPFSGAIYIVTPNGQEITTTNSNTNICPSYASVSCSTIGQPSWCCPATYTCVSPSNANANGLIGCCPAGSTCGGIINVASITTVTVQMQTQTQQQHTDYVYVQPPAAAATTTVQVYNQPTSLVNVQGGYCSTMTMAGPNLPTARMGDCGLVLVVNEGMVVLKVAWWSLGVARGFLHVAMWRMFR